MGIRQSNNELCLAPSEHGGIIVLTKASDLYIKNCISSPSDLAGNSPRRGLFLASPKRKTSAHFGYDLSGMRSSSNNAVPQYPKPRYPDTTTSNPLPTNPSSRVDIPK